MTLLHYRHITVLIHNSGHFGPRLPFWAPGPPALPGLPMASYATDSQTDKQTDTQTDRSTDAADVERLSKNWTSRFVPVTYAGPRR